MSRRNYGFFDTLLMKVDRGLRRMTDMASHHDNGTTGTMRENPAHTVQEAPLAATEKARSTALMRINHAGEIAAQGLYHGQALVARDDTIKQGLEQAAAEENDHLNWCKQRVEALNGHVSALTPLWYAGSVGIGVVAGLAGDRWSLGFIAETEYQVIKHLDKHLGILPETDDKSRAILQQMKIDEAQHATHAIDSGGVPLPYPVKKLMALTSKIMTTTAAKI